MSDSNDRETVRVAAGWIEIEKAGFEGKAVELPDCSANALRVVNEPCLPCTSPARDPGRGRGPTGQRDRLELPPTRKHPSANKAGVSMVEVVGVPVVDTGSLGHRPGEQVEALPGEPSERYRRDVGDEM